MHFTDIEEIKLLAKKLGLRPSPSSGQHFLIDQNVLDAIVEYANVGSRDRVLEIGPGFGALTRELVARARSVLAVEMDSRLAAHLSKEFSGNKHFLLERGDILRISNQNIAEKLHGGPFRVISNIPYHITGKIIRKFVSDQSPKPADMVMLVQKEVAERVCAQPGKMNLLALATQVFAKPSTVFTVPKEAFWPRPAVESALLHIARIQAESVYRIRNMKRFWQVARIGFSAPRKQLHNNLVSGLRITREVVEGALAKVGVAKMVRAQELSVEEWVKLSELL